MHETKLDQNLQDFDPIRNELPQTGWLARYVELSDGVAACPRFRFFSAIAVLGSAINNKMYIQRGTQGTLLPKFFANPWVLLLAPPGRGYKTSTISMACRILRKACPEVRILADQTTPEALCEALSTPQTPAGKVHIGPSDAVGLIKAPELALFFGKQHYNSSLISLITTLYDYHEVWSSATISRGKAVLHNTCIVVFGGSTPQWLQSMLPQDAFTGGFMARFVIVEMPGTYYKRVARPVEPSQNDIKELVNKLTEFGKLKGEFKLSPAANDLYDFLYESYTPIGDPQYDSYKEREAEQILRISLLLSIAEESSEVSIYHIKHAQRIIKIIETETSARIERLSTHPRMALVQEIKELLQTFGPITERDLLRRVYRFLSLGEQQFYEALSILKRADVITASGSSDNFILTIKKKGK